MYNNLDRPEAWVIFIMCLSTVVLYLPEPLAIVSKGFRLWMKALIEDGDGKPSKQDIRDFMVTYMAFWLLRGAFHAIQWMIFYRIDLLTLIITLLSTAAMLLGVNVLMKKQ